MECGMAQSDAELRSHSAFIIPNSALDYYAFFSKITYTGKWSL